MRIITNKTTVLMFAFIVLIMTVTIYGRIESSDRSQAQSYDLLLQIKENKDISDRLYHITNQSKLSLSLLEANMLQTRLDGAQSIENQRTMFAYLDSHKELLNKTLDKILANQKEILENIKDRNKTTNN